MQAFQIECSEDVYFLNFLITSYRNQQQRFRNLKVVKVVGTGGSILPLLALRWLRCAWACIRMCQVCQGLHPGAHNCRLLGSGCSLIAVQVHSCFLQSRYQSILASACPPVLSFPGSPPGACSPIFTFKFSFETVLPSRISNKGKVYYKSETLSSLLYRVSKLIRQLTGYFTVSSNQNLILKTQVQILTLLQSLIIYF